MIETISKDGITITLDLNNDRSVNLRRKMIVKYSNVETEMYPDTHVAKIYSKTESGTVKIKRKAEKYGTIQDQFNLVKAIIKFDDAFVKAKNQN